MQTDYEVPDNPDADEAEAQLRAFCAIHVANTNDHELRRAFGRMRKWMFRGLAWSLFKQYRSQAGDDWSWEAFFTFLTALLPLIAQLLILFA
jgi:hypothetical protein